LNQLLHLLKRLIVNPKIGFHRFLILLYILYRGQSTKSIKNRV